MLAYTGVDMSGRFVQGAVTATGKTDADSFAGQLVHAVEDRCEVPHVGVAAVRLRPASEQVAAGYVLYQFGSGPIKGFAVMLMIGIVSTLFCATIVTRLMFEHYVGKGRKAPTISI